ncbi:DUF4184 family protein [soil metagenome]
MPFTFSHPAIVLPLNYISDRWVSLTGLVIGSIVPDFEKFIKMEPGNTFSHTWFGIFWFNLPLAIILTFVFHQVVRNPLINNLPAFFRKRLYRYTNFYWKQRFKKHYVVVTISIIIGAASHIIWDRLTYEEGYVIQRVPLVLNFFETFNIYFYNVLDIISSGIGAIIIFYTLIQLPPQEIPERKGRVKIKYWFTVLNIFFLIVFFRLLTDLNLNQKWELLYTSISAGLLSLILSPLLLKRIAKGSVSK